VYDSLREHPGHRSKNVDEFTGQQFDYVLTVCDNAKESCPIFPSKTMTIHRNFEDPAVVQGSEEERFAVFRRVRDEIRDYLRELTQRSSCNQSYAPPGDGTSRGGPMYFWVLSLNDPRGTNRCTHRSLSRQINIGQIGENDALCKKDLSPPLLPRGHE
jgi:hypothetical protein